MCVTYGWVIVMNGEMKTVLKCVKLTQWFLLFQLEESS
jgi:hypothetical protein